MKAPAFWYRPAGSAAFLLEPVARIWDAAGRWRRAGTVPFSPGVPVVCVGNLVAGGAGKTPVALAVGGLLAGRGLAPHFLSRGYGGRLAGPLRVDATRHRADEVGDEPLLLAAGAPTWIGRDRAAAARLAVAGGAGTLVLDDGFQNSALSYRLSLVVVDGAMGFGNRRVIPAGPLRERVEAGLARASALVILGEDRTGVGAGPLPVFRARLAPDPVAAEELRGQRLLAFAGIGRPAKFFETLEQLGADLADRVAFADHHAYGAGDLDRLVARAGRLGARLVTTAKDHVRLPRAARAGVAVLPVTVAWEDGDGFARLLAAAVGQGEKERADGRS